MFEPCGYDSTLKSTHNTSVYSPYIFFQLPGWVPVCKTFDLLSKSKILTVSRRIGERWSVGGIKNTSCYNMPPSILHIESIYLLHFLHLYNGFQDYCNFYATIFWYVVLLHNSIPACGAPRTTPITSKIRCIPSHLKWFFSDVSPLMPIWPLSNEFIQQKSPVNLIHVALMKL